MLWADSNASVQLPVGASWVIDVSVRDENGYLVAGDPEVTVTLPGGTTEAPTFAATSTGRYRATYAVVTPGRHVAHVATANDAVDFAAWAIGVTTSSGMPTAGDYVTYHTDFRGELSEVEDALNAEAAAQRSVCRVGAYYPDDLRQALLRRVMRNLAMRRLPLAVLQGDVEMGSAILPGRDPEVRRFEAPHRKLVIG